MKEHNAYIEQKLNNKIFVRTFDKDVLTEDLVWHRDHNDREIEVLEGSGWEIQFENSLPRQLKEGDKIWIPAETYHRVKRGNTNLIVKIEEF